MESKHRNYAVDLLAVKLLIEPVWNRNLGKRADVPTDTLLIEPVWNRN